MMKKFLLLVPLLFLAVIVWGQSKPIKVVFDITSKDSADHQTTMRHVKMMSAAYPDSEFEVVVYGGALPMVLKEKSTVPEEISQFEGNPKVTIYICKETMKRHQIDDAQLVTGVKTVPDGILEIVNKQSEGWGYIKEAHD